MTARGSGDAATRILAIQRLPLLPPNWFLSRPAGQPNTAPVGLIRGAEPPNTAPVSRIRRAGQPILADPVRVARAGARPPWGGVASKLPDGDRPGILPRPPPRS